MNLTKQLLIDAKALIENPDNWIQHLYAQNARGNLVAVGSPSACKFCSVGAVRHAASYFPGSPELRQTLEDSAEGALDLAAIVLDRKICSTLEFNDARGRTHAEVLALFDTAIKSEPESKA